MELVCIRPKTFWQLPRGCLVMRVRVCLVQQASLGALYRLEPTPTRAPRAITKWWVSTGRNHSRVDLSIKKGKQMGTRARRAHARTRVTRERLLDRQPEREVSVSTTRHMEG